MLYSHFGPIWSTSYGHHLWMIHKGVEYNYHNLRLPSFCHLLSDPETFYNDVRQATEDESLCRALTDYVFHSKDQNQLMFEDYEKLVDASPFEVVFFKGYDHREIYPTNLEQPNSKAKFQDTTIFTMALRCY